MKKFLCSMLFALLSLAGIAMAEVRGEDNPHLISDEIAYRQLFLLLTVGSNPESARSVQAYCDNVLKLTQPEKEELLQQRE
jgi:hypothetical protein